MATELSPQKEAFAVLIPMKAGIDMTVSLHDRDIPLPQDWETRLIPIEQIRPFPDQPRKRFDPAALQELADSIREVGLQQPITVLWSPEIVQQPYVIIMGERRFRASLLAEQTHIRATCRVGLTRLEHLVLAATENLARRDLDTMEEANCFATLLEEGMQQAAVAEKVGRSPSYISNALRLRQLPPAVQEMVAKGELTAGHARNLIAYAAFPEACAAIARYVIDNKLSVRHLEENGVCGSHLLIEQGLAKRLNYQTPFAIAQCNDCPHKARFKSGYEAVCLLPMEWQKKADATAEEKSAKKTALRSELVQVSATVRAAIATPLAVSSEPEAQSIAMPPLVSPEPASNLTPELPLATGETVTFKRAYGLPPLVLDAALAKKLPLLRHLEYNAYERVRDEECPGCTNTCPCRALGIDYSDTVTEICVDPARRKGLRSANSRNRNKVRKTRFAELWERVGRILASDPAGNEFPGDSGRAAVALVVQRITDDYNIGNDARKRVADTLSTPELKAFVINGRHLRGNDAEARREFLAKLPLDQGLEIAAKLLLAHEIETKLAEQTDGVPLTSFLLGIPDAGNSDKSLPPCESSQQISREMSGKEARLCQPSI